MATESDESVFTQAIWKKLVDCQKWSKNAKVELLL